MQLVTSNGSHTRTEGSPFLLPLLVVGGLLLFFAAPWSWQHKAHAALHGLCAQTPSHTLQLGGHPLPFDSRMTGIYGGFLVTMFVLLLRRRHLAGRLPSIPTIATLALFVVAMGVDGFNSLLLDMRTAHLYTPDNRLRLLTGTGSGIAIACVVCYLFAISLWRHTDYTRRVVEPRDLLILLPAQLPFWGIVLSGLGVLALPVTLLLLISALVTLGSLCLIAIVLFRYRDSTYSHPWELQGTAAAALVSAVAVMALLSGARFLTERLLNIPPLT